MKRLTTIALCSVLALAAACGKSKKAAPAKTEAAATGSAAAGSAAATTPGQAAAAAGQAAAAAGQAAAAAGQAAVAADQAAAAGQAAAAAGQAAAAAGQAAAVAGKTFSDAEVEALGGKMLGLMESVAGAVDGNSADCSAMAGAVEKVITGNQALIAEVKAAEASAADDGRFEAWMEKNKARTEAVMTKMAPGMTKCAGDAKLQEVFTKLAM